MTSSGDKEAATSERKDDKPKRPHATTLYVKVEKWQWPIVYSPEYNIAFMGLEKLHPFDAGKWGRVYEYLKEFGMFRDHTTVRPMEATLEDLMVVHSKRYIDSLKLTNIIEGIQEWSVNVAGITEVPPVALMPNFVVQRKVLRPFRFHTGGTILAAKLAVDRGWAINIGGGFHHCCAEKGGGFCAYADITLAIRFLQQRQIIKTAMIVDLDAHQGNGHARDFMNDKSVYILDIYNRSIYPHDGYAKRGISRKIELSCYTEDEEYLQLVKTHVEGSLNEFKPDLIVYNAGTDILDGDPLGCLSISPQGIVQRDEIVFTKARSRGLPILMVTSGGYQKTTAQIIANSILNLKSLDLVECDEAANAPEPPPVEPPPQPIQSAMKRSISEGTSFFSRLRRSTNCFTMTRSPTTPHIQPTKTLSTDDRLKAKSDPKLDVHFEIEKDSDDEDEIFSAFMAATAKRAESQPEISYPSLDKLKFTECKAEMTVHKPNRELPKPEPDWDAPKPDPEIQMYVPEPELNLSEPEPDMYKLTAEMDIGPDDLGSELDYEKMSLTEALSGLRDEAPPALRTKKSEDTRSESESRSPIGEPGSESEGTRIESEIETTRIESEIETTRIESEIETTRIERESEIETTRIEDAKNENETNVELYEPSEKSKPKCSSPIAS